MEQQQADFANKDGGSDAEQYFRRTCYLLVLALAVFVAGLGAWALKEVWGATLERRGLPPIHTLLSVVQYVVIFFAHE